MQTTQKPLMTTAFELKELSLTESPKGLSDLSGANTAAAETAAAETAAGHIRVERRDPMQSQPNLGKFFYFVNARRDVDSICRRRRSMRRFGGRLDGIRKEQHHRAGHGATRPGGRHAPKRHEDEQHVRGAPGVGGMAPDIIAVRDVMHSPSHSFLDALQLPSADRLPGLDSLHFIDTVGWEDADADDLDTFQSMLRALNRYNLTRLRAVIWTLHPGSIRKTEGVARMAKFIDQFDDRGRIWDNVILICK